MSGPGYIIKSGTPLGRLATFTDERASDSAQSGREGTLASTLVPGTLPDGLINVAANKDFKWTLSRVNDEVPYIRLNEYKCVDSSIKRQYAFYTQLTKSTIANARGSVLSDMREVLDAYRDIWPKDKPTKFVYKFPYFSKTNMELSTEPWAALDSVGESIKKVVGGLGKAVGLENVTSALNKGLEGLEAATDFAQMVRYPAVGVTDRPKIFMAHNDRSITISFTLLNTINQGDWKNHRDLIYLLMSQNLFNKRDFTTGVPPVFYDIHIPGQYYCYAACMTNIKVENLGNQRLLYGTYIVPDAYQVELTLTELVKPSKNQFEAVVNGSAGMQVNTSEPSQYLNDSYNGFKNLINR